MAKSSTCAHVCEMQKGSALVNGEQMPAACSPLGNCCHEAKRVTASRRCRRQQPSDEEQARQCGTAKAQHAQRVPKQLLDLGIRARQVAAAA